MHFCVRQIGLGDKQGWEIEDVVVSEDVGCDRKTTGKCSRLKLRVNVTGKSGVCLQSS